MNLDLYYFAFTLFYKEGFVEVLFLALEDQFMKFFSSAIFNGQYSWLKSSERVNLFN